MIAARSDPTPLPAVPLGELVQRLSEAGTALCEAQIDMARAELARDLRRHVSRLRVVAAAMLLVMSGLQLLVVALVLALSTTVAAWAAALLISVLLLFAGAALLVNAPPAAGFLVKTLESLKDDLRWLKVQLR